MTAAYTFLVAAALVQLSFVDANTSNLRAGPASDQDVDAKLADTVRALDTNGNGKVDQAELAGFAKSQGLSSEEVMADFQELDVNKDGSLDRSEIGPLFGVPDTDASKNAVATKQSTASAPPKPTNLVADAEKPTVAAAAPPKEKAVAVAAEVAPAAHEQNPMGLDVTGLERDSQKQAGAVIASRLAQRAQVLLARSAADEKKAQDFDAAVRALRSNATALSEMANEETRKAARDASSAVSQKSLAALNKLQEDEHQSEMAADERREQAKKAMERVRKAQASLRAS